MISGYQEKNKSHTLSLWHLINHSLLLTPDYNSMQRQGKGITHLFHVLKNNCGDVSVSVLCCCGSVCLHGNTCHACRYIHMSTDTTTIEATFPKGNKEETENLTLGHQKVPTLLNSAKNNRTGSEGCLHHHSDKPFSIHYSCLAVGPASQGWLHRQAGRTTTLVAAGHQHHGSKLQDSSALIPHPESPDLHP